MKAQKVRKGFGLRMVRMVLGSRVGRWLAVGITLLLMHLDIAPAVASAEVARARGLRMSSASMVERLSGLLLTAYSAVVQLQRIDTPPLAPAPGLPPAWGASASVYGGVVNLGNGNLCLQVPLVGWANGVSFSLVFNSQANPSQPSPIAPKWTHNWNVFLQLSTDGRQATLQEGDGSRWVYRDDDLNGVFTPPAGVFDQLVRQSDGRYVLERKGSEERWEFAASGTVRLLERVVDRYGRAIVLGYANGRLQTVTDRYNRMLTLVYQGARLWQVVDFTGRTWELRYDANGRLWKVVFPVVEDENGQERAYQIEFGYNGRGNVISWTDRLGQRWEYGYVSSTSDALKWFKDPAGNQWTAFYSSAAPVSDFSGGTPETGSSRWVDPTRVWVEYGFAGATVVRLTQGGNATTERLTTRLWYNGQYQVVKRQDPAGLVWEWSYDGQGNLLWSKEPNGATTTYTYYQGTDRVWKVTDALGHVWEYTYTEAYGDVKSVQDPEGGVVQYVYDYELNEPAYGQVRKVIDALGRATEYQYYAADEANLARRGQVKRVIVPGGYWRELDYGGLGWVVRREVQTASGSEATTYTYDAWGRLRGIDYPRSADVSMGWDGENRRVWVVDGAGRREYTYDAWGRVVRQQGCCGNEPIDIVAVEASYDAAGRRTEIREITEYGTGRTIYTFYDGLGRVKAIGPSPYPPDSEWGDTNVIYHYDSVGRLWKEAFPNGNHFIHSYYGTEAPEQIGRLKSIQLCLGDCTAVDEFGNPLGTPVFGYEYRYDRLGRVVWSREQPSGDETVYDYSPAGRLVYEGRTGDVGYWRLYSYQLDGSRAWVWRYDNRRGEHFDWYSYDTVSGRLTQVEDAVTGAVNRFAWSPEGTLARWEELSERYDRVYSYDEEGRLVQIARDYRDGSSHLRLEDQYNADGFKGWEREWFETPEGWRAVAYRLVCGIGCGSLPLVIYRDENGADEWALWSRYQWVTDLLNGFWYEGYEFESPRSWRNLDYELLAGYLWVADVWMPWRGGGFVMHYWDRYGLVVGERFYPAKTKERFRGRQENEDWPGGYVGRPSPSPIKKRPKIPNPWFPKKPKPVGPIIDFCNGMRRGSDVYDARQRCLDWFNTPEGQEWFERCKSEDPDCADKFGSDKCCLWKCMEEAGAGPGEAAEAVECLLKGYGGVWKGL